MVCPKCKKEMKLLSEDTSFNFETTPKTEYQRQRYVCEDDDVWIKIETPATTQSS